MTIGEFFKYGFTANDIFFVFVLIGICGIAYFWYKAINN